MYNLNEKAVIFLDSFLNLEYKHKKNIIQLYSEPSGIFNDFSLCYNYLTINVTEKVANAVKTSISLNYLDSVIENYNSQGVKILTYLSSGYPKRLKDTPIYPLCLYAKGNVSLLNSENMLSIVGSRKTIPQYLTTCESYAKTLTENGVVIVTGVAVGGDLSAIKGGLNSGNLILVLASGLDFIASEINRDYINATIKNGGLVISEYPSGVPQRAYHYPVRNRIIAGLSQGSLIVSGEVKSGARHTATFSLDYGREVFAFPYSLGISSGELCNELIKDGAYLVSSLDDIISVLGYDFNQKKKVELTDTESKVVSLIGDGYVGFDDIVSMSGLKVYELMPVLTTLEIKGVIGKNGGNEYSLIK